MALVGLCRCTRLSLVAAVRGHSSLRCAGSLCGFPVSATSSGRVDFGGVAPGLELWLSCCGSGPQLPCGMWDLPRAEIKLCLSHRKADS